MASLRLRFFLFFLCLLVVPGSARAASVLFNLTESYTGGNNIYDIQAADVDGDGDADLVDASLGANVVTVRLNDGTGKFGTFAQYPGNQPVSIAIADFDQDGRLDLAIANLAGGSITLRKGTGGGNFAAAVDYPCGPSMRDLVAADLDGDGFLDLAAVQTGGRVWLLRGHGPGGFDAPTSFVRSGNLKAIAAGDIDGDGRVDLAVVDYNGKRVVPLRNLGGLAFTALAPLSAGTGTSDVVLADLDGDGDRDVAVTNEDHTAMVWQNSGVGVFGARVVYPIGTSAQSMAVADMDLDGRKDLVVSNFSENSIVVLPSIGGGFFGASQSGPLWSGHPRCTAVADFNGDGKLDVAAGGDFGGVLVFSGRAGPGVPFVLQPQKVFFDGNTFTDLLATDLDGDGDRDLVVAQNNWQRIGVMTNDGTGGFATPAFLSSPTPAAIVSGDFNRDGRRDIVAGTDGPGSFSLFLGVGNGTLAPPIGFTGSLGVADAAVLDINLDGTDDVVAVRLNSLYWRLGSAFSPLAALGGLPAGITDLTNLTSVTSGEFTGDSWPDIAVVSPVKDVVRIYRNQNGLTFVPYLDIPTHHLPRLVNGRDVDGDGRTDLVVGTDGTVDLFRNLGSGTWAARGSVAMPGTACRSLDLADFNGDGVLDVLVLTTPDFGLHVLEGGPDLALSEATVFSAGIDASSVVATDLNGDGLPDGAVTFKNSGGGLLFLANTRGAAPPPPLPNACAGLRLGMPDRPTQALVLDLDGDGIRDIGAVTESGLASFLKGQPGTPSGPRFDFAAPVGAQSIAAADLDADGAPELAITDTEGRALRLYRRSGTEFAPFADVEVGEHPRFVLAADLDRDGRPDLATANDAGDLANGSVTILFNRAGATWRPEPEPIDGQAAPDPVRVPAGPGASGGPVDETRIDLPVGIGPLALAAADLDGDGELDLVVNERGGTLSLLYALGGGRFHPAQSLAVSGNSTAIVDLDGDGRLDLAVADAANDRLQVLYNTAVDPWSTGLLVPTEDAPTGIAAFDLNTDGLPDLAYATANDGVFGTRLLTPLHQFRNGFPCGAGSESRGVTLIAREDGGVDAYVVSHGEDEVTLTSFSPVFFARRPETEGAGATAGHFGLEAPRPNPATSAATIAFALPARGPARLGIYDVRGRLVRGLIDGPVDAGRKEVAWDGRDANGVRVVPGVYFYRLVAAAGTRVERLILLGGL